MPSCAWSSDVCSRSEEHTSELQSLTNLVCRLLLEKQQEDVQHLVECGQRDAGIPLRLIVPPRKQSAKGVARHSFQQLLVFCAEGAPDGSFVPPAAPCPH